MEYLLEFILELFLEGSIEVSKNRKIPKYIRYPVIVILSLFFLAVIGLLFLVGILSFQENILFGILFILIGLLMFIMGMIRFRKTYFRKVNHQ